MYIVNMFRFLEMRVFLFCMYHRLPLQLTTHTLCLPALWQINKPRKFQINHKFLLILKTAASHLRLNWSADSYLHMYRYIKDYTHQIHIKYSKKKRYS